jgi:hypothetical protein
LNPIHRWEKPELHDLFAFWDGIRKSVHLSRSEKLSKYLINYFIYNDEYFKEGQTTVVRSNFEQNLKELIEEIKQRSYPELRRQMEDVEKELGVLTHNRQ